MCRFRITVEKGDTDRFFKKSSAPQKTFLIIKKFPLFASAAPWGAGAYAIPRDYLHICTSVVVQ